MGNVEGCLSFPFLWLRGVLSLEQQAPNPTGSAQPSIGRYSRAEIVFGGGCCKPALSFSDELRVLRAFGAPWNTLSAHSSPFLDHFGVQVYARKFLELARTFGAVTFAGSSSAELASSWLFSGSCVRITLKRWR